MKAPSRTRKVRLAVDVTPLVRTDAQVIQSYAGDGFKVSGQRYDGPVCVSIDRVVSWPEAEGKAVDQLVLSDFDMLLARASEIDVLLLGTGAALKFPDAQQRMALKTAGLNVEIMDTGAACRTYNVLMADGRRVVAALLPVA